MKKLISVKIIYLTLLLFNNNYAMHRAVHERTPTHQSEQYVNAGFAILPKNYIHDSAPIEAKVIGSAKHDSISRTKTQDTSSIKSPDQFKMKRSQSFAIGDKTPIATATEVTNLTFEKNEPIVVYNAQGQKVSEIFHDNSSSKTIYKSDGDIITTNFDSNGIKQQEITKKLNGSLITKFYNEEGIYIGTETINPDGSKISTTTNAIDGTIVESQVHNKLGQIEGSSTLDDYGNRRIRSHQNDGTTTENMSFSQIEIQLEDGNIFIQTSPTDFKIVDPQGNLIQTIAVTIDNYTKTRITTFRDAQGKLIQTLRMNRDETQRITTGADGKRILLETFPPKENVRTSFKDNKPVYSEHFNQEGDLLFTLTYTTNIINGITTQTVVKKDPNGKIIIPKFLGGYNSKGKFIGKNGMYDKTGKMEELD